MRTTGNSSIEWKQYQEKKKKRIEKYGYGVDIPSHIFKMPESQKLAWIARFQESRQKPITIKCPKCGSLVKSSEVMKKKVIIHSLSCNCGYVKKVNRQVIKYKEQKTRKDPGFKKKNI